MGSLKDKINNPKFKYGTMSTVVTLSVVAIFILIYAISIMLNNKYDLSFDMTSKKIFELSEESKSYISKLNNNIIIRVLSPERDFLNHPYYQEQYHQVNHILKMYKKYGKNITLIYDDIVKNPKLADKYDEDVSQYSVIIETSNGKYKVLNMDNLFEIQQGYMSQNIKSSKADQAIISSIMAISSDSQCKVGILSGHQEADISGFEKLLTDNLYEVLKVNLLTSEIPQDLSMIVIAAPQKDFTEDEIKKLNGFLNNAGKNMLYFAGLAGDQLTNLELFLKNWDININKAIVYDEANMTQLGQYSALVEYTDKELFKSLVDKNAYSVFLNSKPVTFINNDEDNNKTHVEFVNFSDTAIGLKYTDDSIESPDESTIKGPFSAILKTSKLIGNQMSSVIVSSSVISVDSALLYQIPVSNADVYLKIINSVTDKKDLGINIVDKEFRGDTINIKQSTVDILRLIFIVFIPAVVIGVGLSVWMSRRNK